MATSGKGKSPFGSVWPTPEGTTGKDLDPRSAGDAANETAVKDFFFGGAAPTTHAGGLVAFPGGQSVLTVASPAVIRRGGTVAFAGAQSTLTAAAGTLIPSGSAPARPFVRGLSLRGRGGRRGR